jgi:hypothetical protein
MSCVRLPFKRPRFSRSGLSTFRVPYNSHVQANLNLKQESNFERAPFSQVSPQKIKRAKPFDKQKAEQSGTKSPDSP